jgi:hypothetical protein
VGQIFGRSQVVRILERHTAKTFVRVAACPINQLNPTDYETTFNPETKMIRIRDKVIALFSGIARCVMPLPETLKHTVRLT